MKGVVREVSDDEILEHRAMVARWGFGCEPASAASVAGLRKLLDEQVIGKDEQVVCILTGHELKDANATVKYHTGIDMKAAQDLAPRGPTTGRYVNQPVGVEDDLAAIIKAIGGDASVVGRVRPVAGDGLPTGEY
jgi:threonine synthase